MDLYLLTFSYFCHLCFEHTCLVNLFKAWTCLLTALHSNIWLSLHIWLSVMMLMKLYFFPCGMVWNPDFLHFSYEQGGFSFFFFLLFFPLLPLHVCNLPWFQEQKVLVTVGILEGELDSLNPITTLSPILKSSIVWLRILFSYFIILWLSKTLLSVALCCNSVMHNGRLIRWNSGF